MMGSHALLNLAECSCHLTEHHVVLQHLRGRFSHCVLTYPSQKFFVKEIRVQKLTCVLCSHTSDLLGSLDRARVDACAEGNVVLSLWIDLGVLQDETWAFTLLKQHISSGLFSQLSGPNSTGCRFMGYHLQLNIEG